MVKRCIECGWVHHVFCAYCERECNPRTCACRNVFYCDERCQELHWPHHQAYCNTCTPFISVRKVVIATTQLRKLCEAIALYPESFRYIDREIYVCNAEAVNIRIPRYLDGAEHTTFRIFKCFSTGLGSVTTFNNISRTLYIYRCKNQQVLMLCHFLRNLLMVNCLPMIAE
jgi:hypothetical protein